MTIIEFNIRSTSDILKKYMITIDDVKNSVTCTCKSGRIRGYCKHIKFYKKLIKSLLHENPGVEKEKGGK